MVDSFASQIIILAGSVHEAGCWAAPEEPCHCQNHPVVSQVTILETSDCCCHQNKKAYHQCHLIHCHSKPVLDGEVIHEGWVIQQRQHFMWHVYSQSDCPNSSRLSNCQSSWWACNQWNSCRSSGSCPLQEPRRDSLAHTGVKHLDTCHTRPHRVFCLSEFESWWSSSDDLLHEHIPPIMMGQVCIRPDCTCTIHDHSVALFHFAILYVGQWADVVCLHVTGMPQTGQMYILCHCPCEWYWASN